MLSQTAHKQVSADMQSASQNLFVATTPMNRFNTMQKQQITNVSAMKAGPSTTILNRQQGANIIRMNAEDAVNTPIPQSMSVPAQNNQEPVI